MLTYAEADKLLGKRVTRRLSNNTYLRRGQLGELIIELHGNPIIVLFGDGSYELSSCSWRTVTTKARLNEFSPARVYQEKGKWYVGMSSFTGGRVIFTDGIRVTA